MRLGITMIFYLTHAAEYLEMKQKNALQPLPLPLSVSGLAAEGTILLPIQKDPEQVEKERRSTQQKNSLISAARNGDEDAMESLTMDDIDTYAMISQRLTKEDVFSIVDSFFMPSGLECDQYSVMGEITEMNTTKNAVTGERVYELGLVCNDVPIDICINEKVYLEYRKWEDVSKARSCCRECWNICKGKIKRARAEKEKIQSSFFFCRFL